MAIVLLLVILIIIIERYVNRSDTKAVEKHKKSLNIRLKLFDTHIDTSDSYNNFGSLYYRLGKFNLSI